jgi:DNA-binding NarL/FixJ family response regulator
VNEDDADVIRVLVADDQAIVRDGLATVLDLLPVVSVIGQASNGEEACSLVAELAPDVVLMDLRMPVLDGAAATERIARQHPSTAVLVLTTFADDASIMGALRAGARGYLTKDAGRAEVAAAVRAVARGQTTLAAEVGARLISGLGPEPGGRIHSSSEGIEVSRDGLDTVPRYSANERANTQDAAGLRARFPVLTQRECDVLALIGEGLSNTEIASRLFISMPTVKTHINAIFSKLAVRDRAQAITLVLGR